jgi:hypothetical protein
MYTKIIWGVDESCCEKPLNLDLEGQTYVHHGCCQCCPLSLGKMTLKKGQLKLIYSGQSVYYYMPRDCNVLFGSIEQHLQLSTTTILN